MGNVLFSSDQVDCVDEFLNVEVDIHLLCEIHCTGVSRNPLDDRLIDPGGGK